MYHYAANNPVKYVDPDGRSDVYNLDANSQAKMMTMLNKIIESSSNVNDYNTALSFVGLIPTFPTSISGIVSTFASPILNQINGAINNFLSVYKDTQIEALKNYYDGRLFDNNCVLELTFSKKDIYIGKQDDFATVISEFYKKPNLKKSDLPNKYTTEYYVVFRWKDENGKTLGGKVVKLDNKKEYDFFMSISKESGAVYDEN